VHIWEGGPAGTNNAQLTLLARNCPSCMGKPLPAGVDFKQCGCTAGGAKCPVGFAIRYVFVSHYFDCLQSMTLDANMCSYNLITGLVDYPAGAQVKLYAYAINIGPLGSSVALSGNGITFVHPPKPPGLFATSLGVFDCVVSLVFYRLK
jgi:hypothetical protein